jgi:hypothetical protein
MLVVRSRAAVLLQRLVANNSQIVDSHASPPGTKYSKMRRCDNSGNRVVQKGPVMYPGSLVVGSLRCGCSLANAGSHDRTSRRKQNTASDRLRTTRKPCRVTLSSFLSHAVMFGQCATLAAGREPCSFIMHGGLGLGI